MSLIKPIDTLYNGNYFRSRLEARWAVFFDILGIRYEYEPQGFKNVETGECYLPDFYLPDTYLRLSKRKGIYVEIKPDSYTDGDIPQSKWFNHRLWLAIGVPALNSWGSDTEQGYQLGNGMWDNYMKFWVCSVCPASKIEFWEGNYDWCPECGSQGSEGALKFAAEGAILKRFEHKNK